MSTPKTKKNSEPSTEKASDKTIFPCYNTAKEIIQPIRLHYKILDIKDFTIKVNSIKCLNYLPEYDIFEWSYSDELLETKYVMEQKKNPEEYWILGRMEVHNFEVAISVNSIERACLSLQFFDKKFKRKTLHFENLDIYNKLLENSEKNLKTYSPIEKFFKNKPILDKSKTQMLADQINNKSGKMELNDLLKKFMEAANSEFPPEYENRKTLFYEEGIQQVEAFLLLSQRLAFEHLQGNKITMFQLIQKLQSTQL